MYKKSMLLNESFLRCILPKLTLLGSSGNTSIPNTRQSHEKAYAKRNNATNADLEKLHAEFDKFEDNSTLFR
tara:strand:+ start:268 stop:483 length:216 start_codon:yes stop_codon:yes gene_type:complete